MALGPIYCIWRPVLKVSKSCVNKPDLLIDCSKIYIPVIACNNRFCLHVLLYDLLQAYLSVCLSEYLTDCLSEYLTACQAVCLSVYLIVCLLDKKNELFIVTVSTPINNVVARCR